MSADLARAGPAATTVAVFSRRSLAPATGATGSVVTVAVATVARTAVGAAATPSLPLRAVVDIDGQRQRQSRLLLCLPAHAAGHPATTSKGITFAPRAVTLVVRLVC